MASLVVTVRRTVVRHLSVRLGGSHRCEGAAVVASLNTMTNMDHDLLQEINRLIDEEHALERTSGGPSHATSDRRREIEVALERCWDLVRQRRARRSAGKDPAAAILRSAAVVEHYQQ